MRHYLALASFLAGCAFAQEFRASISGQVTDSTGGSVSGAMIVVTSVERNTSFQAVSNATGRYLIQFLLPGHYTLTAEKEGFKSWYARESLWNRPIG